MQNTLNKINKNKNIIDILLKFAKLLNKIDERYNYIKNKKDINFKYNKKIMHNNLKY